MVANRLRWVAGFMLFVALLSGCAVPVGEADAGIVYTSDITAEATGKVAQMEIPDALNTIATYPIAPVTDALYPELAQAFVELVLSPEGQAVLAKFGFVATAQPE